jgi:biotin carboxyl carrier protein
LKKQQAFQNGKLQGGWKLSNASEKNLFIKIGEKELKFKVIKENGKLVVSMEDKKFLVDCEKINESIYSIIVDGKPFEAEVERENDYFKVYVGNLSRDVFVYDMKRLSLTSKAESIEKRGEHIIRAPMPGKIAKVFIKEGESVKKSQPILTMEAMKMENEIRSPVDGRVKKLFVRSAQIVESRAELAVVVEE